MPMIGRRLLRALERAGRRVPLLAAGAARARHRRQLECEQNEGIAAPLSSHCVRLALAARSAFRRVFCKPNRALTVSWIVLVYVPSAEAARWQRVRPRGILQDARRRRLDGPV